MEKIKIAYLLTPVEFGGAERVSLLFLRNYRRDNIQLFPIILCRPWETDNFFIREVKKMGLDYLTVPTRLKPKDQGSDYLRVLRCAKTVYQEIKKGKFDLLHSNGYFANITGVIAAKRLGIPIVTTCHGFISNTLKYRLNNFLDILAIRFMNGAIAVSDKLRDDLEARGIDSKKIHVVPNAVEAERDDTTRKTIRRRTREQYKIDENTFVLGYVGRLSMEKGIKFLIEAGASLIDKKVPLKILALGDGPQLGEMQKYVRGKGVADRVIFAGFQNNVEAFIPAFDVFVLPSLTEGTSMALLEAMACGLPIVATAVGGTPKVITSRENGLLVPPANPQAITEAVELLLQDSELRQTLGDEAFQTVGKQYGIAPWLEKIESIYHGLLGKRKQNTANDDC